MKQSQTRSTPDAAEGPRIDWPAVLASHDRWLRTVVYARVGEPQAVDEVMQEVSLAAVRQTGADQRRGKGHPLALPVGSHAIAAVPPQAGPPPQADRPLCPTGTNRPNTTGRTDPLDWLLAKERKEQIRKAMKQMPKRDAEILLLKYTEDWSYRQLANHLGISESAVEARLHRARQRFRAELTSLAVIEAET